MTPPVPDASASPRSLRFAELSKHKPTRFELVLTEAERAALIADLGLLGLRKARLTGQIAPSGKSDWTLSATLGATVDQACGISLTPVTTRIDEPVERVFLADWQAPEAVETEMPEDTNTEALPAELELLSLFSEALALALPPFPRAPGAELQSGQFTEPGKTPMSDDDAKPFAGLAKLKLVDGDPPD